MDSGPVYPLSPEGFRRALRVGHGRARIHVDRVGVGECRADILNAATVSQVYDPQVDGLAAEWLAEFCVTADLVGTTIAQPAAGSFWDRQLRCELLEAFAYRGHGSARRALYASCQRADDSANVFGCSEIVRLDGEAGLVFVARTLGDFLAADREFWVDSEALRVFDEHRKQGEGVALLWEHAKHDPSIRKYLDAVAETESRWRNNVPKPRQSVDEVLAAIRASEGPFGGVGVAPWARTADAAELEPVLQLAVSDVSPSVVAAALRCLSFSMNPPVQESLFPLLRHEREDVRLFCARTLGRLRTAAVRTAGLELLHTDIDAALELLRRNAASEDGPLLVNALRLFVFDDADDQHSVVSALVNLLDDNGSVREVPLGVYVYEHSPCMHCREKAVRLMDQWGDCPAWVLEEGRHDASKRIRDLCLRPFQIGPV